MGLGCNAQSGSTWICEGLEVGEQNEVGKLVFWNLGC